MSEWHRNLLIAVNSNPTTETKQRKRGGQARRYSDKNDIGWSDAFEYLLSSRKAQLPKGKPWRNPKVPLKTVHTVYAKAADIRDFIISHDFKVTNNILHEQFDVCTSHKKSLQKVAAFIFSGWNPREDSEWVEDFTDSFFLSNGYFDTVMKCKTRVFAYHNRMSEEYQQLLKETNGT